MEKSSYGGIVVILFICIIGIGCGAVFGSLHVGEEFSKQIIPTSVSTPVDTVSVIDEKNFVAENISVKLYIPKPVVKTPTNVTKNTTNSTNDTTDSSSNKSKYNKNSNYYSNSSRKYRNYSG